MSIPCQSSGSLTVATTVVIARPCLIHGASLTQASAAASLIIYDNATAASGTHVIELSNGVNASTVNSASLPNPIVCSAGATAVVAGTGATAIVYFTPV